MKIFFDTNVYVAEALIGGAAEKMIDATRAGRWRIYTAPHVLQEIPEVLSRLGFKKRDALLIQKRVLRRATLVEGGSTVKVPLDSKDSPILQAAVGCGAHYLVTNDKHLLSLDPCESLRIISMNAYLELLEEYALI